MTRDDILSASDLPIEEFDAPEWGGKLRIRALNGAQREEIEIRSHKAKASGEALGWKGLKALVATYVIVGDDDQPLFTGKNDVQALQQKSSAVLDKLFEFVMKMNAMSKEDAESLAGN